MRNSGWKKKTFKMFEVLKGFSFGKQTLNQILIPSWEKKLASTQPSHVWTDDLNILEEFRRWPILLIAQLILEEIEINGSTATSGEWLMFSNIAAIGILIRALALVGNESWRSTKHKTANENFQCNRNRNIIRSLCITVETFSHCSSPKPHVCHQKFFSSN